MSEPAEPKPSLWLPGLAVALLAILAYLPALAAPFVYDDLARTLGTAHPWRNVISPRLVTELSHAIDQRLFGAWAPGHHAMSLALHALCAVLVLRLVAAIAPLRVALVTALLFAVHPFNSEAVAYVSARADLLCAAACLGATLVWLSWRAHGGVARALLAIALYVVALASKETAAPLPAVWLIAEVALGRDQPAASRRRLLLFCLPLLVLTAAAGAARIAINLRLEAGRPPGLAHLLAQAEVQWRYLGLLLWPRGLTLYHGAPTSASTDSARAWLALGSLLALAWLALWAIRRRAPLAIALTWLLAFLLPGSLLPLRDAMAEHRAYLSSVGALMLCAHGLAALPRRAIWPATAALTVALAALTLMRARAWCAPVILWREAVIAAPAAWPPRYALGDALRAAGDCTEAVDQYGEAARLAPRETRARVNRALCLVELGRFDEAESELRAALARHPNDAGVHNDLGMLALTRGRLDEARGHFLRALERDPGHALARANLARIPAK
jgi:protein O-mannosyl-transferase